MPPSTSTPTGSKRPRPADENPDMPRYDDPLGDIRIAQRRKHTKTTTDIGEKVFYAYMQVGQRLARCFDPTLPVRSVLGYAKAFIIGESEQSNMFNTSTQLEYTAAWEEMVALFPEIVDDLDKLSLNEFTDRERAIKIGMSGARSADTNRLKTYTAEYVPLDCKSEGQKVVLGTGKSKADRGFNHPILGRLLVPIDLLEEYDLDRGRVFDKIQSGDYPVTALQFPAFLYEDGSYDPQNLFNGLLRGHFLIRCFRSIFLGPQNALSAPEQVVINRSCIANRLNVTHVTPAIIAYICVQARFSLTTAQLWDIRHGGFDYTVFHRNIVRLFELDDDWANSTIAWWNKQGFGNKNGNPSLVPTNDDDDNTTNFFELAEAQLAQRKAAMAEASTPEPTASREDSEGTPCPTTPSRGPSTRVDPTSPMTPQGDDSDEDTRGHPRIDRLRNLDNTRSALPKGPNRGKASKGRGKRRR